MSWPKEWTFWIPLPPQELSPNAKRGIHWSVKSRLIKEYRGQCHIIGIQQNNTRRRKGLQPLQAPIRIDLKFRLAGARDGRYRPLDAANALSSIKAGIDGLVDSGLLPGDSHALLQIGSIVLCRTKREHQGHANIEVTLTETGDHAADSTRREGEKRAEQDARHTREPARKPGKARSNTENRD